MNYMDVLQQIFLNPWSYFGASQPWMLKSSSENYLRHQGAFNTEITFLSHSPLLLLTQMSRYWGQQHWPEIPNFGQKYPKVFTWHPLRGETVPIRAGWHCQHQHLSSSPPFKHLHFCFLCYKLYIPGCLWAQSGSWAVAASAGLLAGDFLPT